MKNKNPMLAGLFNMLLPGSGHWYVDKDRGRFIKTLIIAIAALAAMIVIGSLLQGIDRFPVPQTLCTGILLLLVLVPLFRSGQKAATYHNSRLDNAAVYTAKQSGSNESQLARNQQMRDKGMISKQEYDSRKDSIESKK